jgi:hypothetical protein
MSLLESQLRRVHVSTNLAYKRSIWRMCPTAKPHIVPKEPEYIEVTNVCDIQRRYVCARRLR